MPASGTVTAGTDATAAQYNNLRKDLLTGQLEFYTTAGGTTAFTLDVDNQYTAYTAGDRFRIKMNATATGASTLNVESLGAKSIIKPDGSAILNGDLVINRVYVVVYDGTSFQLESVIMLTAVEADAFFAATSMTGANAEAVKDGNLIHRFYTDVTVAATTTPTNLLSCTINGGILGSAGMITGKINISSFGNTTVGTITIRLKYGATTVATLSAIADSGAISGYMGTIVFELYITSATNAQEGNIECHLYDSTVAVGTAQNEVNAQANGTAAEDSTANKTLAIEVEWSDNTAGKTITAENGFVLRGRGAA